MYFYTSLAAIRNLQERICKKESVIRNCGHFGTEEKMEIQKILFPQVGRCTDREMYFRLEKSGFGSNQMLFYDNEKQTIL